MANNEDKILIVDDDPAQLRLMEKLLSKGPHRILKATNGKEAMQTVLSQAPRIVITDWMMSGMDGLDLCRALRQHEGVRFVYVIIVTANCGADMLAQAFDAGADDYIAKPLSEVELSSRVRAGARTVQLESDLAKQKRELHLVNAEMALAHRRLNEVNDQLRAMATTDELTGLINRREAMSCLQTLWDSQDRYGQTFACIMIDVDRFKAFNDSHGHAVGDRVLKETARVLAQNTRRTDKVCRIGGEEFLVLSPHVGVDGATVCAEHLRAAVEQHAVDVEGFELHLTISLGVAERSPDMTRPDDILKAADEALYRSKAAGRNQVTVAQATCALDSE